jgi:hypothetical protein
LLDPRQERVDDREQPLVADRRALRRLAGVGEVAVGVVAAVDAHRRHGVDLVRLGELARLLALRRDLGRAVGRHEADRVGAVLERERGHVLGRAQPGAVVVDRREHLAVQGRREAERLERVEQALLGGERHFLEPDRHPAQHDVARQLLRPRLETRLERVAVRALVPEELDHLELARRRDGRALLQADEVRAFGGPRPLRRGREGEPAPPRPAATRPIEKSRRARVMAAT